MNAWFPLFYVFHENFEKVFIGIFFKEYKNLFLKHSSCPAIFLPAVFEILQKDSNEKGLLFFSNHSVASFETNSLINILTPALL